MYSGRCLARLRMREHGQLRGALLLSGRDHRVSCTARIGQAVGAQFTVH